MTAAAGRVGWWRRNRWGLIALLPVLGLALGPKTVDAYHTYHNADPREPVQTTPGAWTTFAGGQLRLIELTVATVHDYNGEPLALPSGVRPWRVAIEFRVTDTNAYAGCDLWLQDDQGRLFSANPVELRGADVPYAGCTSSDVGDEHHTDAPVVYQTLAYFVLPASAQATAARVTLATALPRFALLHPPARG